jgi:hypothetical protein
MTIGQMRASMTQREFSSWVEFYRLFPFDDKHRFHRPAALIASAYSGKYDDRIEFLSPEPKPEGYSKVDMSIMKALGVRPKRKDA